MPSKDFEKESYWSSELSTGSVQEEKMNGSIFRKLIRVALAAIALTGCVTTKFFPAEGAKRYPPTTQIRVFRSSPPEETYEILGIVTAEGLNENELQSNLKKKAMAVGADGLILRRASKITGSYSSERQREFSTQKIRHEGIAIKFKKNN